MYLTVHAVAGALIGNYVDQPMIAFILGFISHFFLDMLPHYDLDIPTKNHTARELKKLYFSKIFGVIYLDISLTIIVAAILFSFNANFLTTPIVWGMLGSILPDVLKGLAFFRKKNRFLQRFHEFHAFIHYSAEKDISLVFGNLTQFGILVILLRPLI